MSGAKGPTRRNRRTPAAQVGNVVALRAPVETTADIVASVRARHQQQEEDILARLRNLVAEATEIHRARARDCLPIGYAMDRPTLDEWIEIGQRMLGKKGLQA
jgi:hypothetical protein